jgi:hypothetical protein
MSVRSARKYYTFITQFPQVKTTPNSETDPPFTSNKRVVKTTCNHTFHLVCLATWLQSLANRKGTCPSCRAVLYQAVVRPNVPMRSPNFFTPQRRRRPVRVSTPLVGGTETVEIAHVEAAPRALVLPEELRVEIHDYLREWWWKVDEAV